MPAEQGEFYKAGGTLDPDVKSYIRREADETLFAALRARNFCYVLTSRQMGKSSLMKRTAQRLRGEGVNVAELDLSAIGKELTVAQWYYGLMAKLCRDVAADDAEFRAFWEANELFGPAQRWQEALERLIMPRVGEQLIIFIDEIDLVRSLKFSADDLFAGIRSCYNRRAGDPLWHKVNFCLLGVASPGELIRDPLITPFNIGQRITLHDFTPTEALPLADGLGNEPAVNKKLLQRILYWTNGQPYLTQRICRETALRQVSRARDIDKLCNELFFTAGKEKDPNLEFVALRLGPGLTDTQRLDPSLYEEELIGRLDLYRRVLAGEQVPDAETQPYVNDLRLSGITRSENGFLRIRNRIYERAFGPQWIEEKMPDAELRRQQAARRRGIWRATTVAAVIAILVGLTGFAVVQYRKVKAQDSKAQEQDRITKGILKELCKDRIARLDTNANFYSEPILNSKIPTEERRSRIIAQHFQGAALCVSDTKYNNKGEPWHKVLVIRYGRNIDNPRWEGKKHPRNTSAEEMTRREREDNDDTAFNEGWIPDGINGGRIVNFESNPFQIPLQQNITETLNNWARAAQSGNLDSIMAYYADTLDIYYSGRNVPMSQVRDDKGGIYNFHYDRIEINLSNLDIKPQSNTQGVAVLDKTWVFESPDRRTNTAKVQLRLWLTNISGTWLITGEDQLKTYYPNKE